MSLPIITIKFTYYCTVRKKNSFCVAQLFFQLRVFFGIGLLLTSLTPLPPHKDAEDFLSNGTASQFRAQDSTNWMRYNRSGQEKS